ncbi:ATP adenylyltransferase [Cylindrobasidium torrendii FP15055 ss-10]|uniref:ATP adenylyltransferase n=1 Tax=Cylindrobasidium torrendii FP15055 ss-10 TaxID=1314674 RepID=A0A0D7BXG1_9AGAR|nr:ATP adenylyltransferase [Cylindrobasidium torrendii FP15055 ss-10]
MLPHEIIEKVPIQFERGLESGDLLFFPSTISIHNEGGVNYEIRLCPALQKKSPEKHAEISEPVEKEKRPDPFAPPYNPNLLVGYLRTEEFEEEYVVLMNKYSVVRDHFLVVTKEFQSQASPLMPEDLASAYSLIVAADKVRQRVFAFYNCGDLSGASQPHKHIQLIRIDDPLGPPVEKLAREVNVERTETPFAINALPYANHAFRLPRDLYSKSAEELETTLANAFLLLLDNAIATIRHDPTYPTGNPSYNIILTQEHMYIIPRREETYKLSETGDELSVNSLGFAGLLLVKSEEELEAVKKEGCGKILRGVGLESVNDKLLEQDVGTAP